MIQRPLADQRILVVDDEKLIRKVAVEYLRNINENTRRHHGLGFIEADEAESVTQAEQLLKQAASNPYDLVLLDLSLPINNRDTSQRTYHGLNLLRLIKESQTAKGVIVFSNYDDYLNVVESFRGGALDFISKPLEQENLEPVVVNALVRLLAEESGRMLNRRVRDLVAYAEIGLAHSFKVIFSNLLRNITEATDGIEDYARERYGLDKEKDPDDALVLRLRVHQKAVAQARQDWAGLQSELIRGGMNLDIGSVGRMLDDMRESLRPCMVVKRVSLDVAAFDERPVLTFEQDVEAVLREIVLGTLSELPDYGKERQIKISLTAEDTRAGVRFEDDLDPIPEEQMRAINEGQRIIPDTDFGRAWGLSVAQHVALRGGGELVVKTERGRNVVTYHIPLADYA